MPVKILIVDDHDVLREGVRALINRERPRWEICGEAKSAQEAVEECRKLQPNVTVLDITMPGMSGLEVASSIFDLGSRVLMSTMHESDHVTVEVSQAGAQGYVLKSQAGKDLIRGIERILGGGTFFGSESEPQENATTGKRSAEKIAESSSGGRILSLLPEVQPPVLVGAKVVQRRVRERRVRLPIDKGAYAAYVFVGAAKVAQHAEPRVLGLINARAATAQVRLQAL